MSMNFVGMENRCITTSRGGKRRPWKIVRRNIIPKSLTLFHTEKCDFPYSVLFQVKTGDKFSPPFFRPKGV